MSISSALPSAKSIRGEGNSLSSIFLEVSVSLSVTKVPRALDNRLRLFGFELADLLLIFLYLSVSNLFFGPTRLKFPIVWCGTLLLACVLHFVKKGKPENYLQHLLQFKMNPAIYSAASTDTEYQPLLKKNGAANDSN